MMFWLNGAFCEDGVAIAYDDRGLLLGDGVFETLLVRGGVPAFWDEHLERLRGALDVIAISKTAIDPVALDGETIIRRLVQAHGIDSRDASLRITVTRGSAARGLRIDPLAVPNVMVTIAPAPAAPAAPDSAGRRLHVSQYRRAQASVACRIKASAYLDNILAFNEAVTAGGDDALMLNSAGRVACASTANIFVFGRDGTIVTPCVSEGALPGIARQQVIEACKNNGIEISQEPVEVDQALSCELAITNSLVGIIPAAINQAPRVPGKLFTQLKTWYHEALDADLKQRAGAA